MHKTMGFSPIANLLAEIENPYESHRLTVNPTIVLPGSVSNGLEWR